MIRPIIPRDYDMISQWYQDRNMEYPKTMPKDGFIIEGVAAGFLVNTDSGFAILEPFISNRNSSPEARSEALGVILRELVDYAAKAGYKAVYGFSTSLSMLKRAKHLGFNECDTKLTAVMKEL